MEKTEKGEGTSASGKDRIAPVLKWVGAATAVLSLIFGLQQLAGSISDARERSRRTAELLATAQMHQTSRDYDAAWATLEQAAELDADNREVQTAREDLGMQWLENISVREGERTFDDIVSLVAPVLARGTKLEEGQRKADLVAHLGWADFLRYRAGRPGHRPEGLYRQALEIDPDNVYAHTMLGHWTSWQRGDVEEMREHFERALSEGRERAYVQHMRFSALRNRSGDASDVEFLRMAVEVYRAREPLEDDWRREFIAAYDRLLRLPCQAGSQEATAVVRLSGGWPDEHAAALEWIASSDGDESQRIRAAYYRACLLEAGGHHEAALEAYRQAHSALPPNSVYATGIEAAVERLTAVPTRD